MWDSNKTYDEILLSLVFLTKDEYKYIDCSEIRSFDLNLDKVLFDLSNILRIKEKGVLVAVSDKVNMTVIKTKAYSSFTYENSISKEEKEYIEKLDKISIDSEELVQDQTEKILVDIIKSKAKVSQMNAESKHFLISCNEYVYLLFKNIVEECAFDLGLENRFEMDEFIGLVKSSLDRYNSKDYESFIRSKESL